MGNNLGKWDRYYAGLDPDDPGAYIATETYPMGAEWLSDCDVVEDWGCGKGWFSHIAGPGLNIIGIDGSITPFADKVVDLETYRSSVEGIFMRHVAEHNFEYETILTNLVKSFTKRAFIVFFTPMSDGPSKILDWPDGYDNIPDISIPRKWVEELLTSNGCLFTSETIPTATMYGEETYYKVEKI